MRIIATLLAASALAVVSLAATNVSAATNLALSSNGAVFVQGSSFTSTPDYSQKIAEANLLTNTPSVAYPENGDTRYIFGGGQGSAQTLEIALAGIDAVNTFAATFGSSNSGGDRTPQNLSVSVSTDGTTFIPVVGTLSTLADGGEYLLSSLMSINAQYVLFDFGGPDSQYGYGGSGISQLFVSDVAAAPEPTTWVLLLLGIGGIGAAIRMNSSKDTPVLASA